MRNKTKARSGTSRSRSRRAVSGSRGVSKFDGVPVDTATFDGSKWSFDGIMRRVLGFSRAAEIESGRRAPTTDAFDALNLFVRTLDVQTRDKLRVVIRAGRDARPLAEARSIVTAETAATLESPTADLFGEGALSLQHLQRGHAIACATRFDLESELGRWPSTRDRGSLDERVWLRFGRELALHGPKEWSCFAAVGPGDQVEMLYLRRGDNRWWSFGLVVDRPSVRDVAHQRTLHTRHKRKLVTLPLDALVGRRLRKGRGAIERAAHAVGARIGFSRANGGAAKTKVRS